METEQIVVELRQRAESHENQWGKNPTSDVMNAAADRLLKPTPKKKVAK